MYRTQIKIVGHCWIQIEITDENGNTNWYNYDVTNDPDIIDNKSRKILENDETFYKRYSPYGWVKVEECTKNISNELIYTASLKRALDEKKELNSDRFIFNGKYSGKKVKREDIKEMVSGVTLQEMTQMTNLIKQCMRQGQLEIEGFAL